MDIIISTFNITMYSHNNCFYIRKKKYLIVSTQSNFLHFFFFFLVKYMYNVKPQDLQATWLALKGLVIPITQGLE